ncbi:sugar kinase [Phaeacidiphilus oryzae]|uniref:sugar kinase n=1 Tax=Phaeacidiphilus oryzae TaxID=348818 RepID=UPI0007C6EB82|nr:sugar kinase [Phaeacidiphilus oryzae]
MGHSNPPTAAAVCIGETMALLVPEQPLPLERVTSFQHAFGGAESNVARGLVALGVPTAWISRVGADGFGRRITEALAADGVDTGAVAVDPHRPTGLYVKEIGTRGDGTGSRMHYYRRGSAASALGPGLLGEPAVRSRLDRAGLVHVSGITAALSDSALALLRRLVADRAPGGDRQPGGDRRSDGDRWSDGDRRPDRAPAGAGPLISFDLNWRPALWRDPDRDPAVLRELAAAADLVLCGADEAEAVFGTGDPLELRALLPGPGTLVVKDDSSAATAVDRDGTVTVQPALRVRVVEPVGAGDAFAAGYLAGTLRGYGQTGRLRLGHLTAAATLVVSGDHGAPPPAPAVERLLAAGPEEWAAALVSADGIARAGEGALTA